MLKWLYERDYKDAEAFYAEAKKWHKQGYRVFLQGYSAMDAKEYKA